MKFFYKRNLTFDEKVIFSCYSSCENNSKYILHSQKLVQEKVFCFCFFPVDYTRLLTLRTFQKHRFWSWTGVLPNSRNVKPNSIMTSMYTVLAVEMALKVIKGKTKDGRFYSSLLSLPYRFHKWRLERKFVSIVSPTSESW